MDEVTLFNLLKSTGLPVAYHHFVSPPAPPASEKLLEDLFDDNDIYWEKTETYIESEGLYQVLYEI